MTKSARTIALALFTLWGGLALAKPAAAATSGQNGTHDPSRMLESDGSYYVYSTGGGSKSSGDGLVWTNGPRLFPSGNPTWVASVVPNDQGIWAPDGIFLNGQYFLFYSVANASSTCAVGVMTSPTLNPSSADFKWTDHGVVVSNNSSATYCAIDPAPVLDADNNLWVLWGSGYSHPSSSDTLWVTRLDNATGLPSSADTTKPGYPLSKGHEEGGYLYFHAGYYYLWYNTGGCCDGANSSYVIHVARSQKITGGFTGDKVFYASKGSIHGPGHIGIYSACGFERFTYHYYPDTGGSVLGENELTWGADGWPVVGPESTTPLKPCGPITSGGTSNGGGSGGAAGAGGGGLGGASDGGTAAGVGSGAVAGSSPEQPGPNTTAGANTTPSAGFANGAGGSLADTHAITDAGANDVAGCSCSVPRTPSRSPIALFVATAALIARRRRHARLRSCTPGA